VARYVELVGGEGWLEGQAVLVPHRKELAEENACDKIDEELYAWSVALAEWTSPELAPDRIERCALMLASAEYLTLGMVKGNPDAAIPTAARDLYARALLELERINTDGVLIGVDGEPIYPNGGAGSGGGAMFPTIER
jgi:hypothetical protein